MDHARPSSNVMHGACEDAHRACANTLLYFSCLKHVNEMVLGKSRQAHQRKQSFRFPSSLINHSTLLLERSSAKRAKLLVFTIMHSNTRQALRVDAFGLREMVLGKSRQAHQRTIMHSNTRQAKSRQAHQRTIMHSNTRQALNASTRSVYAKWYWVNHGRLTSERKAYLPLPIVTHQSLDPAARALKRQASCLLSFTRRRVRDAPSR